MKKLLSAVLVLILTFSLGVCAFAASSDQQNTADALNSLGMFLGDGKTYALDNTLGRQDGITLIVRMLGKEAEAQSRACTHPFHDVDSWASGYVAYAYTIGIVNGVDLTPGKELYGRTVALTQAQFLTMILRVLGYSDTGSGAEFTWNDPYALAAQTGLYTGTASSGAFTRGSAIVIFWNALGCRMKGYDYTLADALIGAGVMTQSDYEKAQLIHDKGAAAAGYVSTLSAGTAAGSTSGTGSNAGTGSNIGTGTSGTGTGTSGNSGSGNTGSGTGTGTGSSETGTGTDTGTGSDSGEKKTLTYEEYCALTGEQQEAYYNSFASPADFFAWYNAAKAAYDAAHQAIEIGSGEIDLGELTR